MKPLKPLTPGSTIAIISLANWLDEAQLHQVRDKLQQRGYKIKISKQSYARHGQFAGDDAARVEALHDAFADPEIDAIICARGGYGSVRLLDQIDYDLIAANPKIFVGFSDLTALLNYIPQRCGFPTFHGPMVGDLANDNNDASLNSLLQLLSGESDQLYTGAGSSVLIPGQVTAPVYGGNLVVLSQVAGTDYFPKFRHSMLLLEDINEPLYKIDRTLNHLRLLDAFSKLKAVLLGTMINVEESTSGPFGFSETEIYRSYLSNEGKSFPVVGDLPFGHMKIKRTMPLGWPVTLVATPESVTLTIQPGLFK